MRIACPVCLAADHASDLSSLVRWQAIHLDNARSALLPTQVELGVAKDRIRELEEIVDRQNRKLAGRPQ